MTSTASQRNRIIAAAANPPIAVPASQPSSSAPVSPAQVSVSVNAEINHTAKPRLTRPKNHLNIVRPFVVHRFRSAGRATPRYNRFFGRVNPGVRIPCFRRSEGVLLQNEAKSVRTDSPTDLLSGRADPPVV